ncbi:MAG: hypothetical protein ABS76_04160 [Pelagibacterium sp. SCN 64-44]|nr:MAG: hypothetical protein ABS76_04160 [Pelagibacterium sp. SCN 64-44]
MAKIWFGTKNLTRYEELSQQRERRRAIMDQGMARSDAMRNYLSANINRTASTQVQTTEMQLRSKAQAAAKARLEKLNKLV